MKARKKRRSISQNPEEFARLKKLAAHLGQPQSALVADLVKLHAQLHGVTVTEEEIQAVIPRPAWARRFEENREAVRKELGWIT